MRQRESFRMSRLVNLTLVGWLVAGCTTPAVAQLWERYLKGSHGPYRGRVIDPETKQPLAGAAVVAVWERVKVQFLHSSTVFYEAREVLTDANGEFTLHAEDVERNAPDQTLRPHFKIFLPGYGSYPGYQVAPKGFLGGIFEGTGVTVELPRLRTREERQEHISRISPYSVSQTPFKDIPNFVRLTNSERVSLGLWPYEPPEKQP